MKTTDIPAIVCIGNHQPIIQSILDFDHMIGRAEPSIKAIIAGGRKFERYFFGEREVAIPVVGSVHALNNKAKEANFFLNVTSGRRAYESSMEVLDNLSNIQGGVLFAENMPEQHATKLIDVAAQKKIWIIGPASVGLLIPGYLKLGAIAGVDYAQLQNARAATKGNVAVFSASGGMTNELIWNVTKAGHCLSFALSFGGERFPIFSPAEAFLEAEVDEATESIVYYGELGGDDEYELVRLKKEGKLTKPVYAFIAGTISDLFEEPPQFGHAKAMAKTQGESAQAKREALREVGIQTPDTFAEFLSLLNTIPMQSDKHEENEDSKKSTSMDGRKKSLFMSSVSREKDGKVEVLGSDLTELSEKMSFAELIVSMFLGKKIQSKEVVDFVDIVLKLLVDHGPHVSGAVNTMITARAGRDMVSSLASGILTIGPRFGGAINEAAHNWFTALEKGVPAQDFVESFAAKKQYISGIGHKKYRTDNPDPRVAKLLTFVDNLEEKKYTTFAQSVETITTDKKANLILNLDGAVAAIMLDLLSEKEGLSPKDLQECIDTEFFNALFILPRSAGFIAHYLDQKRLDEGLFRLPEDEVMFAE